MKIFLGGIKDRFLNLQMIIHQNWWDGRKNWATGGAPPEIDGFYTIERERRRY